MDRTQLKDRKSQGFAIQEKPHIYNSLFDNGF